MFYDESHVWSLRRHVCGVTSSVTDSSTIDGLRILTFKNLQQRPVTKSKSSIKNY